MNKINIAFEKMEKEQCFKECNLIMPYYLDSEKFLEENVKYINNLNKCKGMLIFCDDYKNINYEKIEKYKERIKKLIGEKTIGDKNYFISDEKIYKTSDKLTKEEKIEIRKIKNRISAQKSRNQQKQ